MIVADPRNPVALQHAAELRRRLPPGVPGDGVAVVIGGDGFMLRTVSENGLGLTYLGLSAGHLGFLLNDVDDWDRVADRLRASAWQAYAFPLIEAQIHHADGSSITDVAINDVYLERASGQTARIRLSIDGKRSVESLVCDGIISSTALGSTAYNYSAGGPACHPTLRILLVTAICPHRPRLAPFALHADAHLHLEVLAAEHRPVRAVVDGREHEDVASVDVRISNRSIDIAYFDDHDFTSRMVRKILLS